MNNWTSGYFAASGYTYGFYPESSPSRMAWVALLKGVCAPSQAFSYLDLGCGQGFGLCALAAAHPNSQFVGVDFMPEHIAHARQLAENTKLTNVEFKEGDFVDLQRDNSYHDHFDYVCAHGLATWVTDEVRKAMLELASNWIRPGGLFYCSYNTWPGWLAMKPFQNLVLQLQACTGSGEAAFAGTKDLFNQLQNAGALVFDAYPTLKRRLHRMADQEDAYLLQEYNNQAWRPAHVADMFTEMAASKFSFLGSATLPDLFDATIPAALTAIINAQTGDAMRETIRDIAVNQAFRRDVYVKGRNKFWPEMHKQAVADTGFFLIEDPRHRGAEAFRFKVAVGKINCDPVRYGQLIDKLSESPKTVRELLSTTAEIQSREAVDQLTMSLSILLDANMIGLANDVSCDCALRFNRVISDQAGHGAPYRHLVAPKAGTAIEMTEFDMLAASTAFNQQPQTSLAVVENLRRRGRSMVVDGGELTDEKQLLHAVNLQLKDYFGWKAQALKRLGGMA